MRTLQVLSAAFSMILLTVSQAQAAPKVNDLLDATSDTTQCRLLPSNPYLEKKVDSDFKIGSNLIADVYVLGNGIKNPTWIYIVKDVKTKKIVTNLYLAYEGSNAKSPRSWQPALGTCGGLMTQTVFVGTPDNTQIKKQLGVFTLTQPWGALTTTVPSYKNIVIK
jgi:hypothetical protein